MIFDWNFWLSVITVVVAVVALFLTKIQIRTSNKQHLFDKRLENYIVIKGLTELYKENIMLFNRKNEPFDEIAFVFTCMMNNSYFEEIINVLDSPMQAPYHQKFLEKLEHLKNESVKAQFLYNGNVADAISLFVYRYQELLRSMYQYFVLYTLMKEKGEKMNWSREKIFEEMNENKKREKIFSSVANLKQAYENLQKINFEKAIKKQLQLK